MAANNNTADVYVIALDGTYKHVGKGINKQNLMLLSASANHQFQTLTSAGKTEKRLLLLHEEKPGAPSVEPEAAKIICKWIDSYDPSKSIESQVLTLNHLPQSEGGPTIQEVVHLYMTVYAFRISRERRGNALRDAISEYVHQGPLSENEFRMLHDLLAFDDGLLKSAQQTTIYSQVHGFEPPKSKDEKRENKVVRDKDGKWHVYSRPDPEEFKKIEAFAKERGVYEVMEDARCEILCRKEETQLSALQFQTREAHRLNDRKKATALRSEINTKLEVVKKLKEEMAVIKKDREEREKARQDQVKKAEGAAQKTAEAEDARKQKQKPL